MAGLRAMSAASALAVWLTLAIGGCIGTARAAEVILYDLVGFGGRSVTLTQSAPDLDFFDFDNDVEAIRVISGTWSFHRDDGFQNNNGPPIVLGPGDYPDIELLGFPEDRMSSVFLVQDTPPPAPDCPAPYQTVGTGGRCVFLCAQGTLPDPASGECQCAPGLTETGSDEAGRRICGPNTLAPPTQPPPVLQLPDPPQLPPSPITGQQPIQGTTPLGDIQFAPAREVFRIARDNGFSFLTWETGREESLSCSLVPSGNELLLVVGYSAGIGGWEAGVMHLLQGCAFRLFGGRQLAPDWSIAGRLDIVPTNRCAIDHGRLFIGEPDGSDLALGFPLLSGNQFAENPLVLIQAIVNVNGNICDRFTWSIQGLGLRGPLGHDWRRAFQ